MSSDVVQRHFVTFFNLRRNYLIEQRAVGIFDDGNTIVAVCNSREIEWACFFGVQVVSHHHTHKFSFCDCTPTSSL